MKWLVALLILVAATAQAEIYRWRDGRGTVHYTNSEYEIPVRYRSRATVLNLGLPPVAGGQAPAAPGAAHLAVPANPVTGMPIMAPQPPVAPPPAVTAPASSSPVPRATGRQRPPRPRPGRDDD